MLFVSLLYIPCFPPTAIRPSLSKVAHTVHSFLHFPMAAVRSFSTQHTHAPISHEYRRHFRPMKAKTGNSPLQKLSGNWLARSTEESWDHLGKWKTINGGGSRIFETKWRLIGWSNKSDMHFISVDYQAHSHRGFQVLCIAATIFVLHKIVVALKRKLVVSGCFKYASLILLTHLVQGSAISKITRLVVAYLQSWSKAALKPAGFSVLYV